MCVCWVRVCADREFGCRVRLALEWGFWGSGAVRVMVRVRVRVRVRRRLEGLGWGDLDVIDVDV